MFPSSTWNPLSFVASFLLVLVYILFSSDREILILFVVLGQAHFLLTYLYQFRGGKIGWKYLSLYALALISLFMLASASSNPQVWTFVLAGTVFAVHFFVDEIMMHELPMTRARKLLGGAFVFLYSALLVRGAYDMAFPLLSCALAVALAVPILRERLQERTINVPDMFFLGGIFVLCFVFLVPWSVSLASALGFIILFHYARWYLFMFFRFLLEDGRPRLFGYIRDVVAVNVIAMIGYTLYRVGGINLLRYVFDPTYFYIWTILHVMFSVRLPKKLPFFRHAAHS